LRLPVLGAGNEWRAIHRLRELGVETMQPVAYGVEGWNPAELRSLLVTEELRDCISLERYCEQWRNQPPPVRYKRILIRRLAKIARTLHENGVNHRDFYICHFLIRTPWDVSEEALHLYLIDLHRVQLRQQTPRRWVIKDLGSLWFSAMELGLSRGDLLRFIQEYRQQPWREVFIQEGDFWRDVQQRADALNRTRPGVPVPHG
jgi:heptose I phosphotransferase